MSLQARDSCTISFISFKNFIIDNEVNLLEEVHIYEKARKIIFLGRSVSDPSHPLSQPLFRVEHSVGGTEENPVSLWRIVFLTSNHDKEIVGKLKN